MAEKKTKGGTEGRMGERLRQRRKALGLTAKSLARAAGVSASYLSQLERGKQDHPSLEVVRRLAEALHVPVGDLVSEPTRKRPRSASMEVAEVPPVLAALAAEWPLSATTTALLATIQWEGRQPTTREGWLHVALAIRYACQESGAEDTVPQRRTSLRA